MSDEDDRHVYEALLIELGPKVLECFDTDIRVRTRAGQADAITDIRQRYGTSGVGKASPLDVRHPDVAISHSGRDGRRERLPRLQQRKPPSSRRRRTR